MVYRFVAMNLLLLALFPIFGATHPSQDNQATLPKLIHTVSPFLDTKTVLAIAPGLFRSAIPGFVNLDVKLDNNGNVIFSRYVGGSSFLMIHLMESTKAAVSQWRFESVPEGAKTRNVQLRLFYDETGHVKISPYGVVLEIRYDCPNKDTVENFDTSRRYAEAKRRCEVHKQPLRTERVRIVYGLMGYRKGFWKAHEKYFPNDNFYIGGGCVEENRRFWKCEMPASQFGEVSFCQKCRVASAKWERQHKQVKFE